MKSTPKHTTHFTILTTNKTIIGQFLGTPTTLSDDTVKIQKVIYKYILVPSFASFLLLFSLPSPPFFFFFSPNVEEMAAFDWIIQKRNKRNTPLFFEYTNFILFSNQTTQLEYPITKVNKRKREGGRRKKGKKK